MKFNASSYLLFAIFCLVGGVLGYGYSISHSDYSSCQVMMTIESSKPVETQLFYDTGKGFNENDSIKNVIYQANVPVILNFSLSGRELLGLRFDPSRSPAKIKIHEIILQYQKEKPFTVPLDSLTVVKDIKSLHYDGQTVTVETAEAAQDPGLYLSRIGPAPQASTVRMLLFIVAGAFIALGVACVVVWAYRNSTS
ncbi:MAG: hypothetical protein JXB42_04735 [Deltaproteobacteria bacterium]|nr:hypothetical protein [Deltaproteobacteria bacterium]